eukprot:COSAG06_NODE_3992_length_4680_cov_2.015499_5_plen_52_part_01
MCGKIFGKKEDNFHFPISVSDYYPMAVDLQVQALQRFAHGERSTKIAQVFRN